MLQMYSIINNNTCIKYPIALMFEFRVVWKLQILIFMSHFKHTFSKSLFYRIN